MYITSKVPFTPKISFDDLFSTNLSTLTLNFYEPKYIATRTAYYDPTAEDLNTLAQNYEIADKINSLYYLHQEVISLLHEDMSPYYYSFLIPKASGGMRQIDAPNEDLKKAINKIKTFFEDKLHVLPHNAAFAYVKQRSIKDALMKHQENESKWFLKLDIKDFFPSCSFEFITQQLEQIFPFNLIYACPEAKEHLNDLIKLCLLNNKLPQGTPISPLLTNIIMVPIDYHITKTLFNFDKTSFIYTRYADDMLISSKFNFNPQMIERKINDIFRQLNTPFVIKAEKTRYGSSAGRNWNLGLMLNKDNKITIGYRKKERFRATIYTFLQDLTNGWPWGILETQILLGQISYFKQIEPDFIEKTINKYNQKFNTNLYLEIKRILKS